MVHTNGITDSAAAARELSPSDVVSVQRRALDDLAEASVQAQLATADAALTDLLTSPEARPALTGDPTGLRQALEYLGIELRWNIRGGEWQMRAGGAWQELDEFDEASLRETIASRFTYRGGRRFSMTDDKFNRWRAAMAADDDSLIVDEFHEWIQSLDRWDGKPRIRRVLPSLLGAQNNHLTGEALEAVMVGLVRRAALGRRADEAPVACDVVPLLIGPQTIGKSSFWQFLMPTHRQMRWFTGIDLSATVKERTEQIAAAAIVEVPEMAGVGRTDARYIKAFISSTSHNYRAPYGRRATPRPARFVLVATSNKTGGEIPDDPTGNTRWAPILCDGKPRPPAEIRAWLDKHREKLWQEARALARLETVASGRGALTEAALSEQARLTARLTRRSPIIAAGVERLLIHTEADVWYPLGELMEQSQLVKIGDPARDYTALEARFTDALRAAGWVSGAYEGRDTHSWLRPAEEV